MVKFRRPSLADIAGYVSSSSYSLTTSQQPRDSSGGGEAFVVSADKQNFPEKFDDSAPAVGLDMAGHDTFIMGPKVVLLDSFIVDLLEVDTSAQTFSIKLLLNIDWDDDGTIEPEVKAKRGLGRKVKKNIVGGIPNNSDHQTTNDTYKTGKYVLRPEFSDHLTTWNPEVVLVNAICDESPVEAGSKFHSIQMIGGRPIISRSILYQPECRCDFSFSNFPFDEFDLELKFSSNKWTSEQVEFKWSERLQSICGSSSSSNKPNSLNKSNNLLKRVVDQNAIHGLSEFQITDVRVCTSEKDVNSMQRYDNSEGAFSQAHLIIRVRRDPYSYLLRVASVAELLMFLEVLSFLTDNGDLSARFSVSGTIFLAMVSLYGPMAEALPKVSVVTRVDKWHLYNFFLLFISNVENLLAFVLRDIIGATLMHRIEEILGIMYLYLVISNLLWFLIPLKTREEYSSFISYAESCKKECITKCNKVVSLLSFGLLPSKIMKMKESGGAAEIKRPTLRKHSSA